MSTEGQGWSSGVSHAVRSCICSCCSCCQSKPEDATSIKSVDVALGTFQSVLRNQNNPEGADQTPNETQGHTVLRFMDEKESQQQTTATGTSKLHQSRMDDLKSLHDTEMAMATMEINAEQRMDRDMVEHSASITEMRRANEGVKVKRSEQLNVLRFANTQRLTTLEERLDTQCSDMEQTQQRAEVRHSQRMEVLSFSQIEMASDGRNRNAVALEAQREHTKTKQHAQQSKCDAANQKYRQKSDDEGQRHEQEMSDLKTWSDNKTAAHDANLVRSRYKNKHKNEDQNYMATHFLSIESKLEQRKARCALDEQTLAENRQTRQDTDGRRYLLIAQTETVTIMKAAMAKNCAESATARKSAAVKRRNFSSDAEMERFLRNGLEKALDADKVFGEEMATFLGMVSDLNAQMMG